MTPWRGRVVGRMMLVLGMFCALFSPAPMRASTSSKVSRVTRPASGSRSARVSCRRKGARDDSTMPGRALGAGCEAVDLLSPSVRARVEPHVRHLVAEHLGVSPDELVPAVSLREELAADSLDMLELVIALESLFDVAVPQPAIREMRSYVDVVDAVVSSLLDAGRTGLSTRRDLFVRSCVVSGRSGGSGEFVRVDEFAPYAIQTIEDDALRAGSGARLEVAVSSSTSDVEEAALAHVRDRFAWLEGHGVHVVVHRA